jgi:hypothetical protein
LLILLEEVDFYVRFNTVKLLTVLLGNRPRQLQVGPRVVLPPSPLCWVDDIATTMAAGCWHPTR